MMIIDEVRGSIWEGKEKGEFIYIRSSDYWLYSHSKV